MSAEDPVATVTFLPGGRVIEVAHGTTLFTACRRAGLPLGSSCDAEGICGRCHLEVLDEGALSAQTPEEARVLVDNRVSPRRRLACLARVQGDLAVRADYW